VNRDQTVRQPIMWLVFLEIARFENPNHIPPESLPNIHVMSRARTRMPRRDPPIA
jgi:hypothetical protein